MTATGQDFSMHAGDSRILQFTCVDEKGDPLLLTGASIEWVMRAGEHGAIVLRKTLDSGVIVTAPAGGIIAVVLVPEDTAMLADRAYHHGVATTKDGEADTLATGMAMILPKVRQ